MSGGKLAAQFGAARQKERDVGYHRRRSSGTLARQAEAGAPFAIFVSRGRALHVTKRGSRIMRVENAKKVLAAHYHGLGHDGGRKGSPGGSNPRHIRLLGWREVILKDQVLEVCNVDGRLHVARKTAAPRQMEPMIELYDAYGPAEGIDLTLHVTPSHG